MKLNVVPLTEDDSKVSSESVPKTSNKDETIDSTAPPSLMFNASESIGSLLMQMQKKEAELKKINKSLLMRIRHLIYLLSMQLTLALLRRKTAQ